MVILVKETLQYEFYAPGIFSKQFIITTCIYFSMLVLPFLIAFSSASTFLIKTFGFSKGYPFNNQL